MKIYFLKIQILVKIYKGFSSSFEVDKNLTMKESLLQKIILKFHKFKLQAIAVFLLLIAGLIYYFL